MQKSLLTTYASYLIHFCYTYVKHTDVQTTQTTSKNWCWKWYNNWKIKKSKCWIFFIKNISFKCRKMNVNFSQTFVFFIGQRSQKNPFGQKLIRKIESYRKWRHNIWLTRHKSIFKEKTKPTLKIWCFYKNETFIWFFYS